LGLDPAIMVLPVSESLMVAAASGNASNNPFDKTTEQT
jgi:hypothetical protein